VRYSTDAKCGYNVKHYLDTLLRARDEGYTIKRVKDYSDKDEKVILLRHDIDFNLRYAYEMAAIEKTYNIQSSYYVYLHSPTYSALAPDNMKIIKSIQNMNHEIGLHYDSRYLSSYEPDLLESIINKDVHTVTQHWPGGTEKLDIDHFSQDPRDLPLKYLSDSGKHWREGCFCEWIGKEDKLHVLIHPIWWIKEGSRDKIIFDLIADAKKDLDKSHTNIVRSMKEYCSRDLKIEY